MTRLSVNINKIALIRNSRGGNIPDVVKIALHCESCGAEGITVHPRPDARHIRHSDVTDLKNVISTELNIEGYPSPEFMELVCRTKPAQVTLVPDPPGALTSSFGWDTIKEKAFLTEIIEQLHKQNIRASVFVGTELKDIEGAKATGADRVELFTEPYAQEYPVNKELAIAPFVKAAEKALELGLGLNAGHDLNLDNLAYFKQHIPGLLEVSIGHALVNDALYLGLEETIKRYLACLK
jgi:pyridoxine 5-phosphate synthase